MESMNNIIIIIIDNDKACKHAIILVELLQALIMNIVIPMHI
jgi:hypothetical protein